MLNNICLIEGGLQFYTESVHQFMHRAHNQSMELWI